MARQVARIEGGIGQLGARRTVGVGGHRRDLGGDRLAVRGLQGARHLRLETLGQARNRYGVGDDGLLRRLQLLAVVSRMERGIDGRHVQARVLLCVKRALGDLIFSLHEGHAQGDGTTGHPMRVNVFQLDAQRAGLLAGGHAFAELEGIAVGLVLVVRPGLAQERVARGSVEQLDHGLVLGVRLEVLVAQIEDQRVALIRRHDLGFGRLAAHG